MVTTELLAAVQRAESAVDEATVRTYARLRESAERQAAMLSRLRKCK